MVTYDEHGGFYDPCSHPAAVPADEKTQEFAFDIYEPRVPALLISPRAPKRVDHTVFDHTGILRYVCEKWDLPPLTREGQTGKLHRICSGTYGASTGRFTAEPSGFNSSTCSRRSRRPFRHQS